MLSYMDILMWYVWIKCKFFRWEKVLWLIKHDLNSNCHFPSKSPYLKSLWNHEIVCTYETMNAIWSWDQWIIKASWINGILMRAIKIELMHHETLLNMKSWINANQTIKALKPRSEASKT